MPQAYFTFAKQIFHSASYFISVGYFTRRRRISLKKALANASAFSCLPSFARTNDINGQKYRRAARLATLRIARISSCAGTAFFCHRQRRCLHQLTAFGCSFKMLFQSKKETILLDGFFFWLPQLDSNQRPCG